METITDLTVKKAMRAHAEAREELFSLMTTSGAVAHECPHCGEELDLTIDREHIFAEFMESVERYNQTVSELEGALKEANLTSKWAEALLDDEDGNPLLRFTVRQRETVSYNAQVLLDECPDLFNLPGVVSRVSTPEVRKLIASGYISASTAKRAEHTTTSRTVPEARTLKMEITE